MIEKYDIIGFAGKMGTGKDTFARILLDQMYIASTVSFAASVKRIGKELFGINPLKKTPENRHILQQIGSKMREINENVWVETLARQLDNRLDMIAFTKGEKAINIKPRVAITDVRYMNEAKWIVESNQLLIILNCEENLRRRRISTRDFAGKPIDSAIWGFMNDHGSEKEILKIFREYGNRENVLVMNQTTNSFAENTTKLKLLLELI
jgi:dephospho-CoA kinase